MVAAPFAADLQHVSAAQVTNQTPDRALRQRHVVRNLPDRAIRVYGNVEENSSVAGDQIPVVLYSVCVSTHPITCCS